MISNVILNRSYYVIDVQLLWNIQAYTKLSSGMLIKRFLRKLVQRCKLFYNNQLKSNRLCYGLITIVTMNFFAIIFGTLFDKYIYSILNGRIMKINENASVIYTVQKGKKWNINNTMHAKMVSLNNKWRFWIDQKCLILIALWRNQALCF